MCVSETLKKEDPEITVAVLEAGEAHIGDPNILVAGQFGQSLADYKYDWAFKTVKQQFSNGREFIWLRGKGLGGSSLLNFYAWIKPPATDIDAFEKLGNPGWNWDEYMKYFQRSEAFHPPAEEHTAVYPHTNDAALRGASGPIHTTVPFHFHAIDTKLFQQTLVNKGLKAARDPYGDNGNMDGQFNSRSERLDSRSVVLTEAIVTRILFDDARVEEPLTATGVEYVHKARTSRVSAKREVILMPIQNPKILELSGVGRPEVLTRLTFIYLKATPDPAKSYLTVLAALNHPFSRGSISSDPFDDPSIDPRYFENDFDLEVLVQHIKYIRTMVDTEPFKSGVGREVDPGPNCVSDQDIREYIKNNIISTWHTVGTCSMMPREKKGVVDPELKVYGTANLRVVDISIVPLHVAAHTQATAYMIAEKAADLIHAHKNM
ncbi:glucose-methanol-choline oxidoreductase [Mycena galericulata]|nr:glucose-methanol-choline oxidoreductase [Mycena galericulata]